ncbi:hypothetical protein [Streptomyces mirabilis]|uniref:hypothetical protein n=1 Tax=Streptomyces mirabilis TaxID=68239 RepID=UPI0036C55AA7
MLADRWATAMAEHTTRDAGEPGRLLPRERTVLRHCFGRHPVVATRDGMFTGSEHHSSSRAGYDLAAP